VVLLALHFLFILALASHISLLALLLFFVAMALLTARRLGATLARHSAVSALLLVFLFGAATVIQERHTPQLPARQHLAIVGGTILTGRANAPVIPNGTVLVDSNGVITAVGESTAITVPDGHIVLDAGGKFLMPGLINAHSHLWRDAGDPDLPYAPDSFAPPGLVHDISVLMTRTYIGKRFVTSRIERNAKNALYTGVTTIREIGNMEFLDVAFRDKVASGQRIGPNMIAGGKILATTGGHSADVGLVFNGPVEARKAVREALRNRVDFIKLTGTGGIADSRRLGEAGELQMTPGELHAVVDEAHRRNFLVAVHAESTQGVREALQAGADNIEHGARLDEDMIALFKNNPKALRGFTSLHPTLSIFGSSVHWTEEALNNPALTVIRRYFELVSESLIAGFRQAIENDVLVGLGTDSGFASHQMIWKELKYFMKYADVSASDAIHMGTLATAKSIGIDEVTGSIEAGKRADILVLNGDPRADLSLISTPSAVSVNGYLHTLQN